MVVKVVLVLVVQATALNSYPNKRPSEVGWSNYNYREPKGRGTYAFGYNIQDHKTSNVQFKNEERHPDGSITGNYGYLLPNGNVQKVTYIADKFGYRATVKTIPRGNLKPIQLDEAENQLFDFSSNLPPRPARNTYSTPLVLSQANKITQRPFNMPNYITAHLKDKELQQNQDTSPWRPYFPTVRTPASFKDQYENYYMVPANKNV